MLTVSNFLTTRRLHSLSDGKSRDNSPILDFSLRPRRSVQAVCARLGTSAM